MFLTKGCTYKGAALVDLIALDCRSASFPYWIPAKAALGGLIKCPCMFSRVSHDAFFGTSRNGFNSTFLR